MSTDTSTPSPEDISLRDQKEWVHHDFTRIFYLSGGPIRNNKELESILDIFRPAAKVAFRVIQNKVIIVEAEYATIVHFYYIPKDRRFKIRRTRSLRNTPSIL